MRRRLIPVLVLAAVGVLAAGCGGSSNKNASAPAAATTTATAAATTASSSSSSSSSSGSSLGGLTGDCKKMADLSTKFSQAMANATNTSGGNPAAQIGQAGKLIHQFADAAPDAVKPDLETLAKAFDQYASAIKGVKLGAGKVPSAADVAKLTKAAQAFSSPQVQAAGQHLSQWAAKNCGVAATTTG